MTSFFGSYGTMSPAHADEDPTVRTINVSFDGINEKVDRERARAEFGSNSVSTAKYTAFSFLPMSLFEQFRRVANFYFLLISILMLIGTYTSLFDTPYAPWSTLFVLTMVVMISVVKGGYEDLKRHAADRLSNHRFVEKLIPYDALNSTDESLEFEAIEWRHVCVGDILRIPNNSEIPADMVMLLSSEQIGSAYIETSNIDGEGNLKVKNSARTGTVGEGPMWTCAADLRNVVMKIQCEHPNSAIHQFNGCLTINEKQITLDTSSLLLRGSSLKNTRWIIGIVVYTGRHNKLVMNSRGAPFKTSGIEKTMNNILLVVMVTLCGLSFISLIFYITYMNNNYEKLAYLCYNFSNSVNTIFKNDCESEGDYTHVGYFFTFFILYSNFLPISLYVTVEICNYYQAYYIDNDIEMYDSSSNTCAVARTSNMNADLGMVEYIFADKTGTLTDNIMRFRRCSIEGVIYGESIQNNDDNNINNDDIDGIDGPGTWRDKGDDSDDNDATDLKSERNEEKRRNDKKEKKGKKERKEESSLPLSKILETTGSKNYALNEFILSMSMCHTCIIESESGTLQSESPDEDALVAAAGELGWLFIGRKPGVIIIQKTGLKKNDENNTKNANMKLNVSGGVEYELLATIPFDNDRKRMSVIIRRLSDRKVIVYSKGADNVMLERSTKFINDDNNNSDDAKEKLLSHLTSFASEGLRTLVFARRELNVREYFTFQEAWSKAEMAVTGRPELMKEAAALIERDLTVIGASAIEDKLQDGVPETITDLANAGIKVWVLTGDKTETAMNIGYSAGLLGPEMILIRLQDRGQSVEVLRGQLKSLIRLFRQLAADKLDLNRIYTNMQASVNRIIFGKEKKNSIKKNDNSNNSNKNDNSNAKNNDNDNDSSNDDDGSNIADNVGKNQFNQIESGIRRRKQNLHDSDYDYPNNDDIEETLNPLIPNSSSGSPDTFDDDDENESEKEGRIRLDQLTSESLALIVDGDTLLKVFGDSELEKLFLTIASISKSVLACRSSPQQKRLLVKLVRKGIKGHPVTLAVGDGANDVAMIQEADIGIGISGKEGRQAVNSSDFSIGQFRFLKRLLLVHGRLDYRRDVSVEMLEKYSLLYVVGRMRHDLNIKNLLLEMAQACVDAILIFGIPYYVSKEPGDVWGSEAYGDGLWIFGTTVYTALVASMFVRIALLTHTWTSYSHFYFWFSFSFYIGFLLIYQGFLYFSYNFYGLAKEMFYLPVVWWLITLVPLGSGMLEISVRLVRREFFPTVLDIVDEIDSGYGEFSELLSFQDGKYKRSKTQKDEDKDKDKKKKEKKEIDQGKKKKNRKNDGEEEDDNVSNDTDEEHDVRISEAVSTTSTDKKSNIDTIITNTSTDSGTATPHGEGESFLKYSKALLGDGAKQIYPLDWTSIQGLFNSLEPQEKKNLGVQSTERACATESTFNFDHVSSGSMQYVPSAQNATLIFSPSKQKDPGLNNPMNSEKSAKSDQSSKSMKSDKNDG